MHFSASHFCMHKTMSELFSQFSSQTFRSQSFDDDDMPSRPWKRSRLASRPIRRRRARWGSSRYFTGRPSRFGRQVRDFGIPRGPAGAGFMGPTTILLNPTNRGSTNIKTTIMNARTLSYIGAPQNGNLVFDPSGTSGNFHNGTAITDWAAYATIFDEYKVNSIIVTARCDPDNGDGTDSWIMMAGNRDTAVAGTLTDMQTKANTIHHTFTQDNPIIKVEITPYVFAALFNDTNAVSTMTRTPRLSGWVDTETPVNLYGFLFYAVVSGGVSDTATIYLDVEYDISFRYRSG